MSVRTLEFGVGVSLDGPIEPSKLGNLGDLIIAHGLVIVSVPHLSPQELGRMMAEIGTPVRTPFVQELSDIPGLIRVVREAWEDRRATYGGAWHQDWSFLEHPPNVSLMYCVAAPSSGGSTAFVHLGRVFGSLSLGLQRVLRASEGIHSSEPSFGPSGWYRDSSPASMDLHLGQEQITFVHPAVREREGMQPVLNLNPAYTIGLKDWSNEEASPLLSTIYARFNVAEFGTRIRLKEGDLIAWDNDVLAHRAVADYENQRRELWRATVQAM